MSKLMLLLEIKELVKHNCKLAIIFYEFLFPMKLILQLNLIDAWWYFCFWVFIKINIHKNMEKCLTINIYYSNEYFIILLYIYKRSGRYTITNGGE